ncbi:MAG: tRNA pseudouridine(55) synthase, partial [Bacteroidales bacterium]|nr:tRNA pseudouridine(55) synthase [Bacteroidales bacterium]
TYIRALARDIGEYLHCGAYLTALQRTRVGDFHLDQCLDIIEFKNNIIQRSYETVEI